MQQAQCALTRGCQQQWVYPHLISCPDMTIELSERPGDTLPVRSTPPSIGSTTGMGGTAESLSGEKVRAHDCGQSSPGALIQSLAPASPPGTRGR